MDMTKILAMIVERACLYVPEQPTGASNVKRLARIKESYPKGAFSEVEKVPKEALTSVESKVFAASSDLVRFK